MADFKIKGLEVTGLKDLQKKLKDGKTLDDVKAVVKGSGRGLQLNMQSKADFTKGYATGQTKHSIRNELKDAGFTAEVGPETEYSPYVEYGTRFMEAQPFVRPAFEEEAAKFIDRMQKLVK